MFFGITKNTRYFLKFLSRFSREKAVLLFNFSSRGLGRNRKRELDSRRYVVYSNILRVLFVPDNDFHTRCSVYVSLNMHAHDHVTTAEFKKIKKFLFGQTRRSFRSSRPITINIRLKRLDVENDWRS